MSNMWSRLAKIGKKIEEINVSEGKKQKIIAEKANKIFKKMINFENADKHEMLFHEFMLYELRKDFSGYINKYNYVLDLDFYEKKFYTAKKQNNNYVIDLDKKSYNPRFDNFSNEI